MESNQTDKVGVLLIHGLTGTPVEFKALEKYLKRQGLEVENVLLAGHAAGYQEMLAATWHDWLASARAALDAVLSRSDRVVVCGLSMGSMIAATLATERPDKVCGVVMLSPTLDYDGGCLLNTVADRCISVEFIRRSVRATVGKMPWLGTKLFWEETPPYGVKDKRLQRQITKSIEAAKKDGGNEFGTFRTYYSSVYQMWDLIDSTTKLLPKVKAPVLIVSSMEDSICSLKNPLRTYNYLEEANKALLLLTGCDHVMTLDLQKHVLHSVVGRFVERFGGNKSRASVREEIAPALEQAKYNGEDTLTLLISPEICALSEHEWRTIYPGHAYPGTASCDTAGGAYGEKIHFHSLVARDSGSVVINIPLLVSRFRAVSNLGFVTGMLKSLRPSTLAMGSFASQIPSIGVRERVGYKFYVNTWRLVLDLFDCFGGILGVDMTAYRGLGLKAYQRLRSDTLMPSDLKMRGESESLARHRNPLVSWFLQRTYKSVACVPEFSVQSQDLDEAASSMELA